MSNLWVTALRSAGRRRRVARQYRRLPESFAAAVASFGMLLRDSPYKGKATFDQALSLAESGRGADESGDRGELISLVKSMQRIAAGETVSENH